MPEDSLDNLDLGKGESSYKEEGTVPKRGTLRWWWPCLAVCHLTDIQ